MIESCRIIYAILWLLLSLPLCFALSFDCSKYTRKQNSIAYSARSMCSSRLFIMELLIAEFLVQVPFILSFVTELKLGIESSKGIYSIFIFSSPVISSSIVCNDFLILNNLNRFCRFINIGDLIAMLGSIDFVLGSVDLVLVNP